MDMKQVKELMAAMEKYGLKKVRIKEEKGFEVEVERDGEVHHITPVPRHEMPHFAPPPSSVPPPRNNEPELKKEGEVKGTYVDSPMVGTFYLSSSPDDLPYVKVGDKVNENTVVCIIEAMKVMNEVKAGKKGTIAEIHLNNGDPVEFGTHIFRLV
jgi:acetyl-CoA carboxylase biotin carboxyl carrier protein